MKKQILVLLVALLAISQAQREWVKRYHHSFFPECKAKDIAIDKNGNILVTGDLIRSEGNIVFGTIKYNPSGDTLWKRDEYYGTGWKNWVSQIGVDSDNNIIVVGSGERSYNDTVMNYRVIKYNPAGETLWARRCTTGVNAYPQSMCLDQDNNTYITGQIEQGYCNDAYTIKVSSEGELRWQQRQANSWRGGRRIVVDGHGSAYVLLDSLAEDLILDLIVKYDSDGNVVWKRVLGREQEILASSFYDIALDHQNNLYVGGTACFDSTNDYDWEAYLVKYNLAGETLWTRRWNTQGQIGIDYVDRVCVDRYNNVIVAGRAQVIGATPSCKDMVVVKYTPLGDLCWFRRHSQYPPDRMWVMDLGVDHFGGVVVLGETYSESGNLGNYLLVVYSAQGDSLMIDEYDNGSRDWPAALAVDQRDGTIYITGQSQRTDSLPQTYEYCTIKYQFCGSVSEETTEVLLPEDLSASPNPFYLKTTFQAKASGNEEILIYNLVGQVMRRLQVSSGKVVWDGRNTKGVTVPVGVYFCSWNRRILKVVKR